MCRSCIDGTKILETFRAYGIAFRSMTEQWIDTTTPWGEALYHISAAWAGLERNLITERVNAGLESARRHGTKSGRAIGRPRKNIDFKNVLEACRHNIGKGGLPNYSWAAAELTKTTGIRVTAGFVQHRLLAGAAEVEQTVQDLMEDTSKTPLQESTEKQLLPAESK
jgi:DNA invertase Pin-like site-specific DNA recombinase